MKPFAQFILKAVLEKLLVSYEELLGLLDNSIPATLPAHFPTEIAKEYSTLLANLQIEYANHTEKIQEKLQVKVQESIDFLRQQLAEMSLNEL
jgi:hypothetical protein